MAALLLSCVGAAADEDPADTPDEGLALPTTTTNFGGASPLATSRTVRHWSGQTTNPVDGVTYRYNMVGADPSTDGSAVIGVDIIPLDVNVGGQSFAASGSAAALVASPIFQNGNYSSTAAATKANSTRGAGGQLSSGNDGVQLLDATMRAQFNKVGTDYHLVLDTPVVHDAVTINVPDDQGTTLTSPGGITYGDVAAHWFATRVQNQLGRLAYLDPTRLALFVTYDVVLFNGDDPMATCCVIGAHGAGPATGQTNGPGHGNGNQPVQTYVWSSWLTAGFFGNKSNWAKRDIHGLSHEIVEWANDPFVDNTVQGWSWANACNYELETGDPVVGIGWAQGANTFDQNKYSDGAYHPEDEVFVPWFMRSTPETQPSQHGSAIGRYTFMGDLNPFAIFHQPAAGC